MKAGCTDDNNNTIAGNITIAGGTITIDSTDDSVHATNITMTGGTVTAATGDDGMHADNKLDIQAGMVTITKSYEGLEAVDLQINGGNIHVNASDDGLNAAGGNDSDRQRTKREIIRLLLFTVYACICASEWRYSTADAPWRTRLSRA